MVSIISFIVGLIILGILCKNMIAWEGGSQNVGIRLLWTGPSYTVLEDQKYMGLRRGSWIV